MKLELPQLLSLLPAWLVDVLVVLTAAGSGPLAVLKLLDMRAARRRNETASAEASLSTRTNALVDQLQEEVASARAALATYMTEINLLRRARWTLEDTMGELRDAATAARSMVHEMERRQGLPETLFTPLPRMEMPRAPPAA